jgi:hypothetical protein
MRRRSAKRTRRTRASRCGTSRPPHRPASGRCRSGTRHGRVRGDRTTRRAGTVRRRADGPAAPRAGRQPPARAGRGGVRPGGGPRLAGGQGRRVRADRRLRTRDEHRQRVGSSSSNSTAAPTRRCDAPHPTCPMWWCGQPPVASPTPTSAPVGQCTAPPPAPVRGRHGGNAPPPGATNTCHSRHQYPRALQWFDRPVWRDQTLGTATITATVIRTSPTTRAWPGLGGIGDPEDLRNDLTRPSAPSYRWTSAGRRLAGPGSRDPLTTPGVVAPLVDKPNAKKRRAVP